MRKTASFVIALLAGLLVWREARAQDVPPAPRGKGPGPQAGDTCGAPYIKPCEGTEHQSCANGHIQTSCCPQSAKCNYRFAPFQMCGDGRCVEGRDPGMCPPPQAIVMKADEAACKAQHGSWEPACMSGRVTPACIMPVPTNYTGPARNPSFRTCGAAQWGVPEGSEVTACTTSAFIEDCYHTKEDKDACLFGWTKVCLLGRISERCIPVGGERSAASQGFTECGGGRCVIGKEANLCPAP